ncbi:LytR/AlgR family response regulator transcription factor [Pedobacter caeni]|uniref:Two component transcriptional regulator, LytTR family n=1 Tax=Pedobacter caeni TaxID=288992 RepID=A0A1M5BCS8_9SPHI|nr:LytTR family DNA-binding domain-containing protein [Pedobacter caeni]SHF40334.1 two component transcriptional regulator, LytTR family [Pedobacter caeni]
MTAIKAIYVDDESPALELIRKYCDDLPEIELLACFLDPRKALAYDRLDEVELFILDIEMPGLSGTEMLALIPKGKLGIFITADPTHAAKAYDLDVIDYLVKPVFPERFVKAVQKAIDYRKVTDTGTEEEFLIFRSDYMLNKIPLKDIQWIEGFGEYLKVITRYKQYMVLQRFSDFIEKNEKLGFVRIHKSYIVQKGHILSHNSQFVLLKDGKQLPVGRTYKDGIK